MEDIIKELQFMRDCMEEDGYSGNACFLQKAIDAIQELQEQMPKWHMVADGDLPQILQNVIVYTKFGHYHLIKYYGEPECFGGDSLSRAHNVRPETVIAWMELPTFKGDE